MPPPPRASFAVGDKVLARFGPIRNGATGPRHRATITEVDEAKNKYTVEWADKHSAHTVRKALHLDRRPAESLTGTAAPRKRHK